MEKSIEVRGIFSGLTSIVLTREDTIQSEKAFNATYTKESAKVRAIRGQYLTR
jgi:hypothetical protein